MIITVPWSSFLPRTSPKRQAERFNNMYARKAISKLLRAVVLIIAMPVLVVFFVCLAIVVAFFDQEEVQNAREH